MTALAVFAAVMIAALALDAYGRHATGRTK